MLAINSVRKRQKKKIHTERFTQTHTNKHREKATDICRDPKGKHILRYRETGRQKDKHSLGQLSG